MAQSRPEPAWSEGTDVSAAQQKLDALLVAAQGGGSGGKWTLRSDGAALERAVAFKTFKAAWAFMDAVAGQCKRARHHPEWSNVYNRVWIRWTTHSPAGLSHKDLDMAATCDELAAAENEVVADASDTTALRQAADTVAAAAGDCCVPGSQQEKKKQAVEREESEAQGSVAGIGGQPS